MDYGNLLNRSWRVVWEHKFMIVLGFLAALGSGLGNNGNNLNYQLDGSEFDSIPFLQQDPAAILPIIGAWVGGLLCFGVILGIALWLLRLTTEAGMIDAASRLDAGQKVTFGEAMSAGWGKIWSMIGLNLLLFGTLVLIIIAIVVFFGLTIGASIASAASSSSEAGGILAALGAGFAAILCCVICGLVLLVILISVLHTFAQRAIVLENLGVIDGIRRGWNVIRDNLGEVIILLLLFLLLGFLVGAIITAIFIPLGALSFGPSAVRLFSGEALSGLDIFLMVVGGMALLVIVAAIRSFYVAFRSSAFTLAFQDLTDKKLPAVE